MKTIFNFIFAFVLSLAPGVFGRMFTPNAGGDVWFDMLNKSVLTPDGLVFGVAWMLLYILLGVALFMIMQRRTTFPKRGAYALFVVHMILNGMWSWMFFGAHWIVAALFVLMGLIVVAVWMGRRFWNISRWASYLVIPYVLWMLFALYLNSMIVVLN